MVGVGKSAEEEGLAPGMAVRAAKAAADSGLPFVATSVGTGDATDESFAHAESESVSKKSIIACLALTDMVVSSAITKSIRKYSMKLTRFGGNFKPSLTLVQEFSIIDARSKGQNLWSRGGLAMRQFSFLHISGKGDIVGEHSLSHLSSYCVLATLAIAAMLTTILIGPIKVDAVQCTVNGRCFRGTSIGENNYGAIVQINMNNIPYMANHASFMLVNSEQNASTQRFAQAGYTVGACAGATAPTLFDEWYDETGYNGACEGPAFSGYHYYYQWRNAYDQWCSGFDGSQCQRYVIAGQNFNMYFGSFLTAYGEVDDTVEVMGGGPGANSGSGYIAEVYYLPSPTSYWVPEPNLGSEYAPCGASPCPYIDSTYYQQQSGHVTVSIYTP